MCIGCMTAAAVMGTVPVLYSILRAVCGLPAVGVRTRVPAKAAPSFVIVWRAVRRGLLLHENFEYLDSCRGYRRAGAEDGGGAVGIEFLVILRRDDAAHDDHDVLAAQLLSSAIICGTRVRCPAASDDTPTTCTSFSTACLAASAGVWKSGPMSTSNPMSA